MDEAGVPWVTTASAIALDYSTTGEGGGGGFEELGFHCNSIKPDTKREI